MTPNILRTENTPKVNTRIEDNAVETAVMKPHNQTSQSIGKSSTSELEPIDKNQHQINQQAFTLNAADYTQLLVKKSPY